MTFLILMILTILLLTIYSACILSGKCSREEELKEIEVVIDDLKER